MFHFFRRRLKTLNRVEIIADNIVQNFCTFRKLLPERHVLPVLKSNAYGHGLKEIVTILKDLDFPYFVVDSYYEALQIWKVARKRKVLVIGWNHPENYRYFHFGKIAVAVYDLKSLEALAELYRKIHIHLMINTGMNREGLHMSELGKFLDIIAEKKNLYLEGVFSHFADAENRNEGFRKKQEQRFGECLDLIAEKGFSPRYIHLGNTAGSLKVRDKRINSFRLGIGLYGGQDFERDDPLAEKLQELRPALRFLSTVVNTAQLKKGETVSYNCTFTASKDMKIGIVPVGYYECLPRMPLSNTGFFRAREEYLPIVGRICMNLTCFDLKGQNLNIGDEVEIISAEKGTPNSVEHIAIASNTIQREILVNISESVRRVIV